MNSQFTAEVAALIASQSLSLVEGTKPFSPNALYDFWFYGQEHLKQRRKVLEPLVSGDNRSEISEAELEVIFKDFFAEEMLIRLVTAVLTAADKRRNQCQAEPIARNVLLSFLEVKRHALKILVSEVHLNTNSIKRINKTRRSIERWTDLLLGQFVLNYKLDEFAHDVARSKDFGEDQSSNLDTPHPVQIWDLITAGLRISFPSGLTSKISNDWEMMLGALLSCYPSDCFHQSATMKTLYQIRIERSGLHPETSPAQSANKQSMLADHSLFESVSQKQSILKQSINKSSDSSASVYKNQSISYSKLKKRNSDEKML